MCILVVNCPLIKPQGVNIIFIHHHNPSLSCVFHPLLTCYGFTVDWCEVTWPNCGNTPHTRQLLFHTAHLLPAVPHTTITIGYNLTSYKHSRNIEIPTVCWKSIQLVFRLQNSLFKHVLHMVFKIDKLHFHYIHNGIISFQLILHSPHLKLFGRAY